MVVMDEGCDEYGDDHSDDGVDDISSRLAEILFWAINHSFPGRLNDFIKIFSAYCRDAYERI